MKIGRFRVPAFLWFFVGSAFLIGYGPGRVYFQSTEEIPWLLPFSGDSERRPKAYEACRTKILRLIPDPETYGLASKLTPVFERHPRPGLDDPIFYSARWHFTWIDAQQKNRKSVAVCTFEGNGQFFKLEIKHLPPHN